MKKIKIQDDLRQYAYWVRRAAGTIKSALVLLFTIFLGLNAWAGTATWNGDGGDADWNNADNWSGNLNNGADVIIPANASPYPIIGSSLGVKSVTIDLGASLTVTTGAGILDINKELTLNGDLFIDAGLVECAILLGAASPTISNGGSFGLTGYPIPPAPAWTCGPIRRLRG